MEVLRADPLLGCLLDGRYEVRATVARGGMATVYRARDLRLDRDVAVKAMHPFLADDPQFVQRFTREARSAARISDRNVVAVHDQGTDRSTGAVFLVMELVRGRTLRSLLDERGRLSVADALSVLEPVSAALAAAHASGVVHRDVKPENVLLGDDGRILVADFGLARAVSASPLTANAGLIIGTVAYLAPEQVRDGSADQRSDVYAAGVLLYELVTGHVPYDGDSPLSVAYRHLHEDVPATGVDQGVDALLADATARDPALRPADGAALLARVRALRPGRRETGPLAARPLTAGALTAGALTAGAPATSTRVLPHPVAEDPGPGPTTVTVIAPPAGSRRAAPADEPVLGALLSRGGTPPRLGRRRGLAGLWLLILVLLTAAAGTTGWWFGSGRYARAPALLDFDVSRARSSAASSSMTVALGPGVNSDTVAAGRVVAQSPPPGSRVLRHATVTVRLSLGPLMLRVPLESTGRSLAAVTGDLAAAGLAVGAQTTEYSPLVPPGTLLRVVPAAGTPLRHGSAVALVLSKGPRPVPVPVLSGRLALAAEGLLKGAGLVGRPSEVHSDAVPLGEVISQGTGQGTLVAPGSTVPYVVSSGPLMVKVPDVHGDSIQDAEDALTAAGLSYHVSDLAGGFDTTVVAQSPRANELTPHTTTVTIYAF